MVEPSDQFSDGTRQTESGQDTGIQAYARAAKDFNLLVFPEGTRGNGVQVAECLPGIYYIAQEARVPIVPVFIENMQLVSTKNGKFHLFGGFRKVEVHFGEPIAPKNTWTCRARNFWNLPGRKSRRLKRCHPQPPPFPPELPTRLRP